MAASSESPLTRWSLAREAMAVFALLALYVGLSLSAVHRKSVTFDEISHLTIGYAHWQRGDYRLHPENGLAQEWSALALLPSKWRFPSLDEPPWSTASTFEVGKEFFFNSGNDADTMLFRARALAIVPALALGFLVYAWSRHLFGVWGGLTSLSLFATCPTILAHGALVTADVAAALFFTASLWALWRVLHRVTPVMVLTSGLAVAGLFLAKMSAVLLIPVGLLLAAVRVVVGRPLTLAWGRHEISLHGRVAQSATVLALVLVHAAVVFAVIWGFYGFHYDAIRADRSGADSEYRLWSEYLERPGFAMRAVELARAYRLLPEPFLFGAASTLMYSDARVSFLNGEYALQGKVAFFPYCFLVKTGLGLLALLGLAAVAGISIARSRGRRSWAAAYDLCPLLVFLVVFWGFALASHLNIGQRHLLPTFPLMYVLAGGAVLWLRTPSAAADSAATTVNRHRALVICLCFCLAAGEALATWPNYLAYFNVFNGGPRQAYKHLVDSSLDWGQDLKELAHWLHENGVNDSSRVFLAYFGTGEPRYYGITATPLPCHPFPTKQRTTPLQGGVYCISATMLQGVYGSFDLFRGRWGEQQERLYQGVRGARKALEDNRGNPAAVQKLLDQCGAGDMDTFYNLHEESVFARLCATLRQREPDAFIGYSILIYRLTDAEAQRALLGPPPYEDRRDVRHVNASAKAPTEPP